MLNDFVLSDIVEEGWREERKKDTDVSIICHWHRQLSYTWLEWNHRKTSEDSDDRLECWLRKEEKINIINVCDKIDKWYPTTVDR